MFTSNRITVFCISLILTLNLVSGTTSAANTTTTLQSLQWGEILYSHFKGDKTDALIRLYARESRGELGVHQIDADLLAAGLLLDLGLVSEAQKRLDKFDINTINPKIKSRLALAMARVYFKSQNFTASKQWLNRINEAYLAPYELAHKRMMHAQILFNQGNFEQASMQLKDIHDAGNLQYYAYYNHGLSLLKQSNQETHEQGISLLQRLTIIEPTDQEQYALMDQAKLAIALDLINSSQPLLARKYLTGIRLQGLVSNDALLLVGWTYAQTNEFDKALTYWNRLAVVNSFLEPVIQEAWLAIPYAHQQLGDLNRALEGYEVAVSSQKEAQNQLTTMLEKQTWKSILSDDINKTNILPISVRRQLMANPKFYHLLDQWKKLERLNGRLNKSLNKLPTITLILEENQLRHQRKSQLIKENVDINIGEEFYTEYQNLELQIRRQKDQPVAEKLLSNEDYQHWKKIQSMQDTINNIPEHIDDKKKQSVRRLSGVASWKFHRQRDINISIAENNLASLKKTLTQLSKQKQTLQNYLDLPQSSIMIEKSQIEYIESKAHSIAKQLEALQAELELAMSEEFEIFIQVKLQALVELAEQANLALARLRFKALTGQINNE